MIIQNKKQKTEKGSIVTYILVFGAVFLVLLSALLGFILIQLRQAEQKTSWNKALAIAEAGVNYYQWCLNNESEANCQKEKDYYDTSGNPIGKFSIQTTSTISCGQTIKRQIVSSGWTNEFPSVQRKVSVLYARESVAKFSYILNDNVWIGSDHEIRGPYHSNGGIRMDGENQSLVTSARENWICTDSFGCSPCPISDGCYIATSTCFCPGVFTTTNNANEGLFQWPVTSFDFVGITMDLAQMKTAAQSSGVYLPPSNTINSQGKGYHLKFINNGTFEVWLITRLSSTYAYSLEEGWHYDYFTISNEYLYATYSVPPACSVIFVEDNIWPEGEIKGKVSLASANLINPNLDTDVVLMSNLDYTRKDGSDGLALVGERNILIGPQSPEKMEIRGIFVAQKGRFGRNHYPNNLRDKLEIYGSIISNGRVGTQWVSGSVISSGYLKRESYFDSYLVYNPPPFVPYIDPDFKMIKWEEVK